MNFHPKRQRLEIQMSPQMKERFAQYSGDMSVAAWLRYLGEREIRRLRKQGYKDTPEARRMQIIKRSHPQHHPHREGDWCDQCKKVTN